MRLILLLLLCLPFQLLAQVRLSGLVTDSLNNPLELANIMAINSETDAIDAYGVSNSEGKYLLNLKEESKYQLKISYVGMLTHQVVIETGKEPIQHTSVLKEDSKLKELELVYEMPITVSGDTLAYKTDAFTNGTEKKLEDVLEKLPGVEVTEDGEIKVEGKTVEKIMVEGKEFFDGDTKLATKNIPADALEKVEVLKNFNEVGMMKNLGGNEDNVAINVKLKEGKKNFWFGEVTAGVGPDSRYIAHPKLFYYSPKYSVNLITDVNNIGEIPFTVMDYFKFTGGFRALNSGTGLNLSDPTLQFLMTRNDRARSIDTKFGALNLSYSLRKDLDLSGFLILSDSKTRMHEESERTYFSETLPDEQTESRVLQRNKLGLLKLSLKYEPNPSVYLVYDVFGKLSEQRQDNQFASTVYGRIDEGQAVKPQSLQQNFSLYKSFTTKDILSVELQHLYRDEDPFYNAVLQQSGQYQFVDILNLDTNQLDYNLNQDKRVKTSKIDFKTKYWYILNKKSNISVNAGYLGSLQRFNTNMYQTLDNLSHLPLETETIEGVNDIEYNINDVYVGVQYRLKAGIFTLHPGFDIHHYEVKNTQANNKTLQSFNRILPMFNLRLQFKKSEHIQLGYSTRTQFTDINTLAEGLVLNRYNSLYQGNRSLEAALNHVYSVGYFNFNQFTFTNIFANISYTKTEDPISVNTKFLSTEGGTGLDQIGSQVNSNFANESLNAEVNLEKTVRKIKGRFEGGVTYSKFNQFLNDIRQINETVSQNYGASLKTNFRKRPNIEVGYRVNVDRYNQSDRISKFYTYRPYVKLRARFLKSFLFTADYTHFTYTNEDVVLNRYGFLNSNFSYQKKDAKFEYQLKVTNILNNTSINSNQSNAWNTSTTLFYVQPRYVVLSATYHL